MSVVASSALAGASGQATDTSYEIKKGLRFNSGDDAALHRTPVESGNRKTWTFSVWMKNADVGTRQLFYNADTVNNNSTIEFRDDQINVFDYNSSSGYIFRCATVPVYRDSSAWFHLVVAFDTTQATAADRVKIYVNGVQQATTAPVSYPSQNYEAKFNYTVDHRLGGLSGWAGGATDAYLSDPHMVDGSALSPTVFGEYDSNGVWQPKKVTEAALITAKESQQPYNTRDNMEKEWSGGASGNITTSAANGFDGEYEGAGKTYCSINGTATFSNLGLTGVTKIRGFLSGGNTQTWTSDDGTVMYNYYAPVTEQWFDMIPPANGVLNTLTITGTNTSFTGIEINGKVLVDGPADNSKLWSATAVRSDWAAANPASQLFDGSLSTYTYSLGGSYEQITWDAITATSSVEVYGRGTTNSWRMIIDGSPVSVVFSGNTVSDNSWRTVSTSFPCSVTGIENNNPGACYAVRIDGKILVNAPSKYNASKTWSEYLTSPAGFNSGRYPDRAFYGTDSSDFAATPANVSGESNAIEFTPPTTIAYTTLEVRGRGTDQTTFSVKIDTGSGYGSAITSTGDKWQTIATSGTLTKLKLWTTSFSGENELGGIRIDGKVLVDGGWGTNGFHLALDDGTDIGKDTAVTAPALDPRGGFDAVLYTGNGASTPGGSGNSQTINDFRFKPDLLIIKQLDYAHDWNVVDSIRRAPNLLLTNRAQAEITNSTDGVLDLNVDGFTLGPNSVGTQSMEINKSGQSYVSYGWKAGGTAVSNTDGTITSTVSADQNYGFSVVKYTGTGAAATVGHGLSAAPKLILCKTRGSATQWVVYHVTTGKDAYLGLNTTDAATTFSSYWGAGTTSTTFGLQAASGGNNSGDMIAYCWSEVAGFSKMGTYAGSSSAVTVNTGFAPKFILIKSNDTSGQEWIIKDKTLGFDKYLIPNNSDAEATGRNVTFNSDGFTVDSGQGPTNWSGRNYIYVAFADYPANNFTPQNLITEENTASKNNFAATTWTGNGVNLSVGGQRFSTLSSVTGGTLSNAINAFNGSGSNWATLAATNTSTAAAVDFNFSTPITGVTKVEMAFDSPSASGDTRGRVNGANSGATRTGTSSGYSDVYTGSAITLTSVGWAINQNSTTGTSSDIVSRIRITDSTGTYFLIDGEGEIGFQPDLVWIKDRGTTDVGGLFDSVRGSTKYLIPSTNGAEGTDADAVTSFTSTGFNVGSGYTSITTNHTSRNLVAWCWKAGGTASSNTDGTITTSVSANPNFGFSVVSYTGLGQANSSFGHGLNATPGMIITKRLDTTQSWWVYHKSLGSSKYLSLDLTDATQTSSNYWGTVNSTVFSQTNTGAGPNNGTQIAYCWSEVPGYSRFSSYVGNGSSTGPVIDCGFKPAFVLIKGTSSARDWWIYDIARGPTNPNMARLSANSSAAEATNVYAIDFLDNGFQLKTSDVALNGSGETYIYAAFADPAYGDLDLVNDTPTANAADPVKGNYATLNPLATTSNQTLSNGNLKCAANGNQWGCSPSTIGMTSGKWYFEATITLTQYTYVGIANGASTIFNTAAASNPYVGMTSNDWGYLSSSGDLVNNTSTLTSGASLSTGDTLGVAFDVDTKEAKWYKNGTLEVTRTLTGDGPWFFGVGSYASGAFSEVNFGQYTFRHTPPTGYKALCTTNLPDPTITDGSTAFDTKLFTGTHPTGQSITGYNFSPDFVWLKDRASTNWHYLFDAIRGTEKGMFSNATNAEGTYANTLTAFNSDGFTLGSDNATNQNGNAYVAWAWDAGTSNTSISAGGLNSSTYNMSAVWSNALTASTLKTATAGFNGDISSGRSEGTGGLTFTPSGGISVSSSVEVYDNNSVTKSRVTVNNVQQSDVQHVSGNWVTVFTGSGTLNSLYNERTDNSGWDAGFYALRIDGKILVDANITPANVPVLASTVRANPSAGFSVVSWTGARNAGDTVAHGLNAAPELVIVKNRDQSTNWMTYHKSSGAAGYLALNLNNAYAAASTVWNSTAPDSSVFTLGQDSESNGNGDDMIAYCFAPVEGYSSFGSYTGNGSTNGPFVYTGFRPAFIMIKRTDSASWWQMWDSSRNEDNAVDNVLAANVNNAEFTGSATGDRFDFCANGFKVRGSNNDINASSGSFAYVCFAENPFKTARAR